jgi:hypothetical protein
MAKVSAASAEPPDKPKAKRSSPLSQSDVPIYTLREAMRVGEALRDEFAKKPTKPLDVAVALDMGPAGTSYKMLTGAAIAYGITEGGARAGVISLTDLGRQIVAPTEEGDDAVAMREAVLKPRVIREFLEKYDSSPLPSSQQIVLNVIESMGVPATAAKRAYDMIIRNAEDLGLLVEVKGKRYVRLDGAGASVTERTADVDVPARDNVIPYPGTEADSYDPQDVPELPAKLPVSMTPNDRVFLTHGKNHKVVDQIKKILTFGKFEAVVSVDQQTVAKPVPDKVMDDMRSCSAAIVHVGAERKLIDEQGNQHTEINPNVLIEIGAAMALYDRRFVLLVERGVHLPSNLQGLYEVRYEGEQLDHEATMKLLEAFNDFR